jgi:hypothetical protein
VNGGKITTFTGRHLDPLAAMPDDIDVRDIAHALALTCRFKGHCRGFYSVAEHSVRVSFHLENPAHPDLALWGLMHDAAEAYLADLGGPIKHRFFVQNGAAPEARFVSFGEAEDRLLEVIAASLGFPPVDYAAVRDGDLTLLATEARDLFRIDPRTWGIDQPPLPEALVPWTWQQAEEAFLARFSALCP